MVVLEGMGRCWPSLLVNGGGVEYFYSLKNARDVDVGGLRMEGVPQCRADIGAFS